MIKFVDFLLFNKVPLNLDSYKIHLAIGNNSLPLLAYYEGKFKKWQEWQTKRNFKCDMVVSLIHLRQDKWLFVGVYKILGSKKKAPKYIAYKTKLIKGHSELIGRVVVQHKRIGRASYLIGRKDGGEFYLSELTEKKLTIENFPGYGNICISFNKLEIIINQHEQTWYGALASARGVYLITDTKTGKQYVGSATGDSGIWQRWSDYVNNGHGGNRDLIKVLKMHDNTYKMNFQYSILEIADSNANDKHIEGRERYWKDVLKTREFGYNGN